MNVVNYNALQQANITLTTTPKSLIDLIDDVNPGFKESLEGNIQPNSIRIYVHSGSAGFRFDGQMVSQTVFIGATADQHLLENCSLSGISATGIGADCIITIQIGHI